MNDIIGYWPCNVKSSLDRVLRLTLPSLRGYVRQRMMSCTCISNILDARFMPLCGQKRTVSMRNCPWSVYENFPLQSHMRNNNDIYVSYVCLHKKVVPIACYYAEFSHALIYGHDHSLTAVTFFNAKWTEQYERMQ